MICAIFKLGLIAFISFQLQTSALQAQGANSTVAPTDNAAVKQLAQIKKQYRLREISAAVAWQRLAALYNKLQAAPDQSRLAELLQTQAYLLNDGVFRY